MYFSKDLYQRFISTIYVLQYVYAIFFAIVGLDKIYNYSGMVWESYLSAIAVQMAPVGGTVLITSIAIAQLVIAGLLAIPWFARLGAYLGFILALVQAADLMIADGGDFLSRAALFAMLAVGLLALIQMQKIRSGLNA